MPQKKKQKQKLNLAKWVCEGSENYNLGLIFNFTSHFIDFSVVMYVFVVTESIMNVLKKIGPPVFVEMAV